MHPLPPLLLLRLPPAPSASTSWWQSIKVSHGPEIKLTKATRIDFNPHHVMKSIQCWTIRKKSSVYHGSKKLIYPGCNMVGTMIQMLKITDWWNSVIEIYVNIPPSSVWVEFNWPLGINKVKWTDRHRLDQFVFIIKAGKALKWTQSFESLCVRDKSLHSYVMSHNAMVATLNKFLAQSISMSVLLLCTVNMGK